MNNREKLRAMADSNCRHLASEANRPCANAPENKGETHKAKSTVTRGVAAAVQAAALLFTACAPYDPYPRGGDHEAAVEHLVASFPASKACASDLRGMALHTVAGQEFESLCWAREPVEGGTCEPAGLARRCAANGYITGCYLEQQHVAVIHPLGRDKFAHEAIHALLLCETGDVDFDHEHAAWDELERDARALMGGGV
jgi:hypothetical protein